MKKVIKYLFLLLVFSFLLIFCIFLISNYFSATVSDEEKTEVTKIIGLNIDGMQRLNLSKEDFASYNIPEGDYADVNCFIIVQSSFISLDSGIHTIKDFSIEEKDKLLIAAARNYGLNIEDIYDNGNSTGKVGISDDTYKFLARKYNLSDNARDEIEVDNKYSGYPLAPVTGCLTSPSLIDDSISFYKKGMDLIVRYNVKIDHSNNIIHYNKTFLYTFKKHDDGSYYLFSIFVKNK